MASLPSTMVQPVFFRGDKTSSLSPASSFVLLGLEAFINANLKQHNQQQKKSNKKKSIKFGSIIFWKISNSWVIKISKLMQVGLIKPHNFRKSVKPHASYALCTLYNPKYLWLLTPPHMSQFNARGISYYVYIPCIISEYWPCWPTLKFINRLVIR